MEHLKNTLEISLAQYCDKGVKRENQDTVGTRIPEGNALLTKGIAVVVADGVSSSSAAQQASQSAVSGFLSDYYATPDTWRTQQSAIRVIQSLNQYLWGQSRNSVREEGYLTTFSCLILKGDKSFIFHVGDTRVYRFRDNHLEQLTRDHTQKIDRKTTYLSRALGADLSLEIDLHKEEVQPEDIFLLTSDGVHDSLSFKTIQTMLREQHDIQTLSQDLAKSALANNSQDNLSIQIVRIDAVGAASQKDAVNVLSQLPFPPPLNAGNKLDTLKVLQSLHESERSQVYLVEMQDGRKAVMKTPSSNYEDDPAYIERFVMEAWIGTRIQNPHVARVLPPEHERNFLYYLTEYIPGPTLGELIHQRAPIDIPDTIELLEQIIKGVRAFHRKDTLHQDIKPENIVIGASGAVIIDFGSCWVAGIEELSAPFARDKILGTLSYSAPEYRYGNSVSQRADQFSLAVIVYEMLTKKHPYGEAYERAQSAKDFAKLQYTPAYEHNPLVPPWLDYALKHALNIDEKMRYSALSEWLKDLQRPNPEWNNTDTLPLLKRHPITVWQMLAITGWAVAIALMLPWRP